MRRLAKAKPEREPTIALINIVFLMLIFFMVAGTLARPLDPKLQLVNTASLEGRAPADALVILPDGRLIFQGAPVADATGFMRALSTEQRKIVRVMPDQALAANTLVHVVRSLQSAGAHQVLLVTERVPQ
jgi:biopolymer transport protein ExbD